MPSWFYGKAILNGPGISFSRSLQLEILKLGAPFFNFFEHFQLSFRYCSVSCSQPSSPLILLLVYLLHSLFRMGLELLKLYNNLVKYPFGKQIFSIAFSYAAPYFRTIKPSVLDVRPGHASVSMPHRWSVQNHIKSVHAIAVCNLVEMTMGIVAETTIPKNLRWIPKGMDIDYLKRADGTLTATANVDPDTIFKLDKYPGDVSIPVDVTNEKGVVVTSATVSFMSF